MKPEERANRAEQQVNQRVAKLLAAAPTSDTQYRELFTVFVHASAARRRTHDARAALAAAEQAGGAGGFVEQALGDASHAVLSLYLAASAAQRYCGN